MAEHFHECAYCGQPCECINNLEDLAECLGCGRKECPGNADDPEVQGREDYMLDDHFAGVGKMVGEESDERMRTEARR